ncbi:MAG: helix-turn-helix domain-containing protein [Victivallales bacterium]|nr:helix-turn-helix domain-containing protein [Victivallales bacterium]
MSSEENATVQFGDEDEMAIDEARRTELTFLAQELQKRCDEGNVLELLKYLEKMAFIFDNVRVEMDMAGGVSEAESELTVGPDMRLAKLLEEVRKMQEIQQDDLKEHPELEKYNAVQMMRSSKAWGALMAAKSRKLDPNAWENVNLSADALIENYYQLFMFGRYCQFRELMDYLSGLHQYAYSRSGYVKPNDYDNVKAGVERLIRMGEKTLLLAQKADFRVDKGEEETGNEKLRMKTVQLVKGLLKPLMNSSIIDFNEYQTIAATITDLAKYGKSTPSVELRLLTQQEVADLLGIGLSNFQKLESEGLFPFKRVMIQKSVRYRSTDIDEYMRTL